MALLLLILGSLLANPARADPCKPTDPPGTKCRLSLQRLRPSQGAVGMWEVDRLIGELQAMSAKARKIYLKKKRIEVVIGPGGEFHIIDGHHHAVATNWLGYSPAYIEVVENLSDLSEKEFWKQMEKRHWMRLTGKNGVPISIAELPRTVNGLKDDPYRSLAGIMSRVKGIKSSHLPFAEFYWADYLRERIPEEVVKNDWDQAVKTAIKEGLKNKAEDLPGYDRIKKKKDRKKKFKKCWESYQQLAP